MSEEITHGGSSEVDPDTGRFIDYRDWIAYRFKSYEKAKYFIAKKVDELIASGEADDEEQALEILEATYEHLQDLYKQIKEIIPKLTELPEEQSTLPSNTAEFLIREGTKSPNSDD
ncbi:MAG TPA: hypothetical protein VLE51_02110 [Candidatus Saccharimonadales bacterium]|nr:hypothetical protein [Candidatus Saccharimonadales bacterium]